MLLWRCFSLPVGGRVASVDGPGSEGGVHTAHDLVGKGILLREPREHLQGEGGRERKEGGREGRGKREGGKGEEKGREAKEEGGKGEKIGREGRGNREGRERKRKEGGRQRKREGREGEGRMLT